MSNSFGGTKNRKDASYQKKITISHRSLYVKTTFNLEVKNCRQLKKINSQMVDNF